MDKNLQMIKAMVEKFIKAYFCEHCGKHSLSKGAMTIHERACGLNPKNASLCFHCYYLQYGFKSKEFKYANPEYDPETRNVVPYFKFKMLEKVCDATGDRVFHIKNKKTIKTIMSQSDWKPCPKIAEGCKNFLDIDESKSINLWMNQKRYTDKSMLSLFEKNGWKITPEIVDIYRKEKSGTKIK